MLFGIPILAILKITFIDIVLSGDNAVVIAMASRSLPEKQQKKAILFGGGAAIALRVVLTAVVAYALKIPLLQLGGGLMLFWIAVKLLKGGDEEANVKSGSTMMDAVVTIVLADLVMSLDNMLAVGGASEGNLALLVMGLLMSMAIIMFSSTLIAKLMNKYGWLVYVGAGILGYTAGEMILKDGWLRKVWEPSPVMHWLFPVLVTAAVLGLGYVLGHKAGAAESEAE
ncbi:MAG TPA: TerC family protein [Symbiobacteriaceae bacterium]